MDIKILLNQYTNLSYDDLIKSSKESLEYIIPQLKIILNSEEDVSQVLIYFTSVLLSADSTATEKEIMFLSDLNTSLCQLLLFHYGHHPVQT